MYGISGKESKVTIYRLKDGRYLNLDQATRIEGATDQLEIYFAVVLDPITVKDKDDAKKIKELLDARASHW